MKRTMSILLAAFLLLSLCACGAKEAAPAEPHVTVDIAVFHAGEPVLQSREKCVTDADGNGVINFCDALAVAHADAGKPEGFVAEETEFGLSITRLWDVEGGGYGCVINDAMAMNLTDPIQDGDYIVAYVYSDTVNWSDTYAFFDKKTVDAAPGENVTLGVSYLGYDDNWNAVTMPLEVTELTVDGQSVPFTASEGSVTFAAPEKGSYLVSAGADGMTLVAPVCFVDVK